MAVFNGQLFLSTGTPINTESNLASYSTNPLITFSDSVFRVRGNLLTAYGYFNKVSLISLGLYNLPQSASVNYLQPLNRFFGINARQDATKLYINKSDLQGLTSSSNNTAEAILIAIILRIINFEANSQISGICIVKFKTYFISKNKVNYIVHELIINLFRLTAHTNYVYYESVPSINPNLY